LLSAAVCDVLAGALSFRAMAAWLHDLDDLARARLGLIRGVPAATTIWRLPTRLDADHLSRAGTPGSSRTVDIEVLGCFHQSGILPIY
jgi:hypothetical protein